MNTSQRWKPFSRARPRTAVAVIGFLLAACAGGGGGTSDDASPATGTDAATPPGTSQDGDGADVTQRGDELVVGLSTFAEDALDPVLVSGSTTRALLSPMFDSFINVDPDGELVPGVFTSWEASEDGNYWTFELREGIQFHGDWGEATAEDVKFSIERYGNEEEPIASAYASSVVEAIDRVEVVDSHTVNIHTVTPDALFPSYMSQYNVVPPLFLLPKQYLEEEGDEAFRRNPIGSGPYQFDSHQPGSELLYTAFDEHWEVDPGYERLRYRLLPDEGSRVSSLRSGEVDVIEVSPDGAVDVRAAELDVRRSPGNIQAVVQLPGTYFWDGPTSDVNVRQALSLAINREELISSLLPEGEFPAMPTILPANLGVDYDRWAQEAQEAYRYDPDEAQRLLEEAGYSDGFELSLYAYELPAAPLPQIAQTIANYWREIGVDVQYQAVDFAALRPWRDAEPNSQELLGQAHTHRYPTTPNSISYHNFIYGEDSLFRLINDEPYTSAFPEVQRMLEELPTEFDDQRRSEMLNELIDLTWQEYVIFPLAEIPAVFGADPSVDWDPRPFSQIGETIVRAQPAG